MMKSLTFEYGGYHFVPFMKLTGKSALFETMAMAGNHKAILIDSDEFSHADFYEASPVRTCDLFKCEENGKIYIPSDNLLEYTGELSGINPLFACI